MMSQRIAKAVLLFLGLLWAAGLYAHDPKLHKGTPTTGQIVSIGADRFELKTVKGNITVTFDKNTKFEHGDRVVDKSVLKTGNSVSVYGTKLPTGELVAKEVLLGIQQPRKK